MLAETLEGNMDDTAGVLAETLPGIWPESCCKSGSDSWLLRACLITFVWTPLTTVGSV
jgi:hypothetical protein